MSEPVFTIPAPHGSDAWQEGRQYVYLGPDELTAEDFDAMDASERAFALDWLDRHPNDHEQATNRDEHAAGAASAAE